MLTVLLFAGIIMRRKQQIGGLRPKHRKMWDKNHKKIREAFDSVPGWRTSELERRTRLSRPTLLKHLEKGSRNFPSLEAKKDGPYWYINEEDYRLWKKGLERKDVSMRLIKMLEAIASSKTGVSIHHPFDKPDSPEIIAFAYPHIAEERLLEIAKRIHNSLGEPHKEQAFAFIFPE
jgi:hypothetical protein